MGINVFVSSKLAIEVMIAVPMIKKDPMIAVAVPAVFGKRLKHFAMQLGKMEPDAIRRQKVEAMSVIRCIPKRAETISIRQATVVP